MSAIRQGEYKLMLDWNAKNEIAARHLYRLDTNPTEEEQKLEARDAGKADQLQALLLAHLKRVDAEKVRSGAGKKANRKKKRK